MLFPEGWGGGHRNKGKAKVHHTSWWLTKAIVSSATSVSFLPHLADSNHYRSFAQTYITQFQSQFFHHNTLITYLWPMLRWHPLRSVPLPEVSWSHPGLRCSRSWWWGVEWPPYWISFDLGCGEGWLVFSVPTMESIVMRIFRFMEVSRRIWGEQVKTARLVGRWGDWGSLS